MKKTFMLCSLVILNGCSQGGVDLRVASTDYSIRILENYKAGYFDIEFQSTSNKNICIQNEDWPSVDGEIAFATSSVFIEINDKKYFYKNDYNSGYCPTGCQYKVLPRKKIQAKVFFKDFSEEAFKNQNDHRILILPLNPYFCS